MDEEKSPSLFPIFIVLIAAIVLLVAYPKINAIVQKWGTPPPPVISYLPMPPKSCAVFMVVDKPESITVQYLMIVGGDVWTKAVVNHQVPPRCRDVVEGQGCLDWLEKGESGWDQILKNRPKHK